MPRSGARQRIPEMLKRSTAACQCCEEPFSTQKRTRSPPTDDPTHPGETGIHVQKLPNRPWPDNVTGSSLGQYPGKQNGSSKTSSQELKEKFLGLLDAKQSTSDICVTDDTTSAGSIKSSVFDETSNYHSASSSALASNHDAKVASLELEYADLSITPDGSSKSRRPHEVISSPSQNSQEDSEPILPPELVHNVLGHMDWRTVMQLRSQLGQSCRDAVYQPAFCRSRPSAEAEFSPSFFATDAEGDLHWQGFNTKTRNWESLPSLNFAKKTVLPSPDPDLFKDYLVAGNGGILCMNVGKSTGREELVVFNPLTRQVKVLPPLQHSRHPVLMHLKQDVYSGQYKIVVAGSAAIGTEDLSLKSEEYDSRTGKWECPPNSDMPCAPFGLNEYQNGVYFTGSGRELLLCVAIIGTRGRGVLAYDLKTHTWIQGLTSFYIPLVRSGTNVGYLATTQIMECGGNVYVFSEQECGKEVFFLIHKLNFDGPEDQPWDEVLRRKRAGGRGLLVYPEFTCAVISEQELCIFNTVEHTIELIDLNTPTEVAPLLPAPSSKANRFHSLNPIGFVYKPSFKNVVCPQDRDPTQLCECYMSGKHCSDCERRDPESSRHKTIVNSKEVDIPAIPQPYDPLTSPEAKKAPKHHNHGRTRSRIKSGKRDKLADSPNRVPDTGYSFAHVDCVSL